MSLHAALVLLWVMQASPSSGRDDSRPAKAPAGSYAQVRAPDVEVGASRTFRGKLATLQPGREPGLLELSLEGGETFGVGTPVKPPFQLGAELEVRARLRVEKIHRILDVAFIDGRDQLLLSVSGSGDAAWAPGWKVERGAVTERRAGTPGQAESRRHGLVFTHRGKRAVAPPGAWRELVCDDGTYWVHGFAQSWGDGFLPPDASTYLQYAIVRVK